MLLILLFMLNDIWEYSTVDLHHLIHGSITCRSQQKLPFIYCCHQNELFYECLVDRVKGNFEMWCFSQQSVCQSVNRLFNANITIQKTGGSQHNWSHLKTTAFFWKLMLIGAI